MANAVQMFQHGNFGELRHGADQPFPSPGNNYIQAGIQLAQLPHLIPAAGIQKPHGIRGNSGFLQRAAKSLRQHPVGPQGLAPAAQNDGIPGLQAQGGGIAGDGPSALINKANDPQGNAHLADTQAVGACPFPDALSHGVGKGCYLLYAAGHVSYPVRRQQKPVQKRGIPATLPGLFHIKDILPDNFLCGVPHSCGHQPQGLSLLFRLQGKHLP